jgi:predicted DNA-binding transcriptional regulator AlpA
MLEMLNESNLPTVAFLRLPQIIGCKKSNPPIPALIPISRTAWLEGCNSGIYPKPVKIGGRSIAWRVQDIKEIIQKLSAVA